MTVKLYKAMHSPYTSLMQQFPHPELVLHSHCFFYFTGRVHAAASFQSESMSTSPKVSYDRCIMNRYHQCMLTLCGDPNDETSEEGIAWVTCDQCKSWYHTVCVGFSEQFCMDQPFTCTCSNPPNSNGM